MSFPATIAPAVWFDGTQQAYSDSAGTLPVSSGRIRRVADPSPLSGAWTPADDASRPTRDPAALSFYLEDADGSQQIAHPSVGGIVGNACTLAISYTSRNDAFGSAGTALFQNDARDIGVLVAGGTLWIYHANTLWFSTRTIAHGARNTIIVRYTSTTVDVLIDANGTITTEALTSITVPATTLATPFRLGVIGGTALYGAAPQALVVARTITDPERDDLRAWLVSQAHPAAYPIDRALLAWVGDSIPASVACTPSNSYPIKVLGAVRAAGYPAESCNVSVPGTGVTSLTDPAQTNPNVTLFFRSSAFYSALRSKNVMVFALGTNDLANGNSVAYTLYGTGGVTGTGLYPAIDAAIAQGWKPIVIVPGPRSGAMTVSQSAYNSARAAMITDLLVNGPARGAVVIDTRSILHFGADGDSDNATYYSGDKVHPIDAGHALLWPIVTAAVLQIIARQYLNMRMLLDRALAANSLLYANPSDGDVLGFFAQLVAEASGAGALPVAEQAAIGYAFRGLLSGNFSGIANPSDADVLAFWTQLSSDASGAATLAVPRYQAIKSALLSQLALNYPGTINPSAQDLLGYFAAVAHP